MVQYLVWLDKQVLKGHIALGNAQFPNGTNGHGIGSYLNVHEGIKLVSVIVEVPRMLLVLSLKFGIIPIVVRVGVRDFDIDGLRDICWTQHLGLSAGDSRHGESPYGSSPIDNVNDDVLASPCTENHLDIRQDSTATMAELRVNHRFSSVNAHEIIRINQIFASKNALQKKISLYALRRNFEFKVKKSDKVRYEVVCANDNCMWRMRATKLHGDNTEAFMIRAFKDQHICSLNIMKRDHRQATNSVIGDIIQPMFDGISRQYKPRDIMHDIRSNYGVNIIYNKAWAAKEVALSGLWGTPEDSYAKLPLWSQVLKSKNLGTFTRIETDDQNRFLYFFMALGASIRGFQHMRRVVAVDGTTLKNRYRGLLYIASCLDGNNQIYPLAYGIGPHVVF
ncbi:uncharacterized protein LOC107416658 isoform X3 [Ziziphus jujuba]|uniref:Uncharacterized protein LOC107416658 isoform X3 n=1 Tax=Ziziphus jujuba TaxID=326968 RepID=A0ABM4A5Z7_ZIZJJ|nr:uncharacterized protein LOC107416658 isoform X3 [Ziziphus jujuba]